MTTSLNPIKPWRNATVSTQFLLFRHNLPPNQYIQGKRNGRVQKELEEQNEKLEKAKAQYTQLKSSAVGSNHRAPSGTYYSETAFYCRPQETE